MTRSESMAKAREARLARQASGSPSLSESLLKSTELAKLRGIPQSYRGVFAKCFSKKASKSLHIKAKCLECSCFQRTEVTHCTVLTCPLWPVRPYQTQQQQQHEA